MDPIPALKRQLKDAILARCDREPITIAARVLNIGSPRMADLMNGRHTRFSLEWLIRVLDIVECDVTITVHPRTAVRTHWMRILNDRRKAKARLATPD